MVSSPYRSQNDKPKNKKNRSSSTGTSSNHLLTDVFCALWFAGSLGLNTVNGFMRIAPEGEKRIVASSVVGFLDSLPVMPLIEFGWLAGCFIFAFQVFKVMRKKRLFTHPVWWLGFASLVFCGTVGFKGTILQYPVLMSAFFVGMIQHFEIIFWDVKRKSYVLWAIMGVAYLAEIWWQYEMFPFHSDYDSFLQLIMAFLNMELDWLGFQPIQMFWALVVGVFGIEGAHMVRKAVRRYA